MQESQQIATEHQDQAAHAHRAGAERHGKEDHPTGHEASRQEHEHGAKVFRMMQQKHQQDNTEQEAEMAPREVEERDVAIAAYLIWQARATQAGTPEEDWFRALHHLRGRA